MKWASVISEEKAFKAGVEECCRELSTRLEGQIPDIVFVFISPHFKLDYQHVPDFLSSRLKARAILGCSAEGIIGAGHEVEQRPAISLTAGVLPGVKVKTFHMNDEDMPDLDAGPRAWESALGVEAAGRPDFVLLADPFSFRTDVLAMGLDYAFPRSAKVGGLASGARQRGQNALYAGTSVHGQGVVGAAFSGAVVLDTVVAQGCRPVGTPLKVTQSQGNVLMGVDGRPPLETLQEIYQGLGQRDRELLQQSLFLGLLTDPLKKRAERGDFLIRNIVGLDSKKGHLAIGAELRVGQTVQFHLRDAETSSEDLDLALLKYVQTEGASGAASALLFSCLGRGVHLYGRPDHDTDAFREHAGRIPLGGFFCNGEIGPIGGTTYLHGYTSCFGIFRDAQDRR